MNISDHRRMMIEIIREQDAKDDFRLLVELQDGAWNITDIDCTSRCEQDGARHRCQLRRGQH